MKKSKRLHCQILQLPNGLPSITSFYSVYKNSLPKAMNNAHAHVPVPSLKKRSFLTENLMKKEYNLKSTIVNQETAPSTVKNSFLTKLSLDTTRSIIKMKLNQSYGISTRLLMNSFKKKLIRKRIKTNNFLSKQLGFPGNETEWLKASIGKLNYRTIYY